MKEPRCTVIFDQVIELSLPADVRFDPESDQDCAATQYVAMGHNRKIAVFLNGLIIELVEQRLRLF